MKTKKKERKKTITKTTKLMSNPNPHLKKKPGARER
jgi:hypothetical protein